MRDLHAFFNERIDQLTDKVEALNAKYNTYSLYRIIVFVAFVTSLIWGIKIGQLTLVLLSIGLFVVAFIWLVKKHNQVSVARNFNQKLLVVNEEEKSRLAFDFGTIWDGAEFADEHHPYTSDLDIYGSNSAFQLLNRSGTREGIQLIRAWLENPASKEEIQSRQKAISELTPATDWRQHLQAHGRQKKATKSHQQDFYRWLRGNDLIISNVTYRVVPYVIMIITLGIVSGFIAGILSFYYLLLPLLIGGYFLLKILNYSKETYHMTDSGLHLLESIENMLVLIESRNFNDERLIRLQQDLRSQEKPASARIRKLRKIFGWLSQRGNQMYQIINGIFLLDFLLLASAEKWRAREKNEVTRWFRVVAEFEALSSMAGFAFANEEFVYPAITDEDFFMEAQQVGHPLIPLQQRVCNDYRLEGRGTTSLITGSNMSGKSTFLRTIGINAVLAFCGAPVCAEAMHLSIFRVFSSMRTKDNLEEHISSFYAELLRLRMLLDTIEEGNPTLFLLDEILKGTNSVDRHTGAASLIMQLSDLSAFGLVSTHDLELGNIHKGSEKIKNFNFSSSIVGEEIVFDYKLREGICRSTNASQLMAKMGIKIKS